MRTPWGLHGDYEESMRSPWKPVGDCKIQKDCLSGLQCPGFNKRGPRSFASILHNTYILPTEDEGLTKKALSNTDRLVPLREMCSTRRNTASLG